MKIVKVFEVDFFIGLLVYFVGALIEINYGEIETIAFATWHFSLDACQVLLHS
jgi:hypothetical protein